MFLIILMFTLAIGQLNAQGHRPPRDDDFDDDRYRDEYYDDHWEKGQLTRDERRLLECKRQHIQETRRIFLRDGYLDPWERRKLHRMHRDLRREFVKQSNDHDHDRRDPHQRHRR